MSRAQRGRRPLTKRRNGPRWRAIRRSSESLSPRRTPSTRSTVDSSDAEVSPVLTLEILPRPTCPVGRFSSFYRSMTPRIIAILLVGFALACDSPARPLPQPQPPAPAPQTRLNVSGIVTDDNGAPLAGAAVHLSSVLGGPRRFTTSANAAGRYE